jgi:Uma2 family endonuclease
MATPDQEGIMSLDLEPVEGTAEPEAVAELGEDRKGYELVDGVWVEKHPDEPPPEEDRKGCELIDGDWVEKPMGNRAGLIGSNVNLLIAPFVKARQLGFVFINDARFRLFADRPKLIRKPDVSFVRLDRFPDGKVFDGSMTFPPDLAVEVVSPSDAAEPLETKIDEYLRAGVRLVWVVYLPTRNVWVYRPDGTAKLHRTDDTLTGEDVLPGFAVRVGELFEGL